MKFGRVASFAKSRHRQRLPFRSISSIVSVRMLSLIFLVGSASELGAQSVASGDILVTVTDLTGAVLSNARVTLKARKMEVRKLSPRMLEGCISSHFCRRETVQVLSTAPVFAKPARLPS